MNDINVIKPVKENERKGIWDKIKNTSAVVAAVAIMTTVGCSSKSEIEWTGDKDLNDQDQVEVVDVEDIDELLDNEEENDFDEEDSDIIEIDMETEDEDQTDEDLIDEDSIDVDIEVDDELLIDEEQDLDTIPDEDTVVEIPETIVHMKFLVADNLIEADAGETIDVNGIEYTVKYDNNDGSIYLMNGQEINRIEWQNSKMVNGIEVSLNDMYTDQTKFESRVLVNVTLNEEKYNLIISEESYGISAKLDGDHLNFIYMKLDKVYPWDYAGSNVQVLEFDSEINGVKTTANNLLINENSTALVGTFTLDSTYSIDLYNGNNTKAILEVTIGESVYPFTVIENETKEVTVEGKTLKIEVDKMFFDEINFKGWANVFVNEELVRTFEQDKPEYYDNVKIELKQVNFIIE